MELWESTDLGYKLTLHAEKEFDPHSAKYTQMANGAMAVLAIPKDATDKKSVLQSLFFQSGDFNHISGAQDWWENAKGDYESKEFNEGAGSELNAKVIKEQFGGWNKKATAIHRSPDDTSGVDNIATPTDDEMEKINQFTKSTKTADDVVALPVKALNDILDRDDDQFAAETVKGFAELEEPLSPIGKSFLVGHDRHSLAVGRIFDAYAEVNNGVTWLKNKIYIPNTAQYKDYLENVDFGIYWAVSVGVLVNSAKCSIGGEVHDWSWWGFMCEEGHFKGAWYDPQEEIDKDDWPTELEEGQGEKCFRIFRDPKDYYELSQVYLGAIYFAEFEKKVGKQARKQVAKSFSIPGLKTPSNLLIDEHILSLKSSEVDQLDLGKFPAGSKIAAAVEAATSFTKLPGEKLKFTTADGKVVVFDPVTKEETILGQAVSSNLSINTLSGNQIISNTIGALTGSQENALEDVAGATVNTIKEGVHELSKDAVVDAARKGNLPATVIKSLEDAEDNGLEALVGFAASEYNSNVELKKVTDIVIAQAQDEVLKWFRISQRDSRDVEKQVDVSFVQEMLKLCGNNLELINKQAETYKNLAYAKFPAPTRRSTFELDIPVKEPELVNDGSVDNRRVVRLHQ
jgi:hypothetical protein